jgi:hypothetical protein
VEHDSGIGEAIKLNLCLWISTKIFYACGYQIGASAIDSETSKKGKGVRIAQGLGKGALFR